MNEWSFHHLLCSV